MYFNNSFLQNIRLLALTRLILSQLSGPLSSALQIPPHTLTDFKGKQVLDVGCGFGEFSRAYCELGASVTATEVIPQLVEIVNKQGVKCHLGELDELNLNKGTFDVILFRAVLYRTPNPAKTFEVARDLLTSDGELSMIDPCVDLAGAEYYAFKHFPQGRYYISDINILCHKKKLIL